MVDRVIHKITQIHIINCKTSCQQVVIAVTVYTVSVISQVSHENCYLYPLFPRVIE